MKIVAHKPAFVLREIKLEVTHQCPLVCIHCSSGATPEISRAMALKKALRLAEQIVRLAVETIIFSGGEPLIWPGILDLVSACARGGARLCIYTSGNVEDFRKLIAQLRKIGVSNVIFSIFGGEARKHEKITRTRGSFEKTLSAIESARAERLSTEMHFVPFDLNYLELPKIVSLAAKMKVKKISVLRFVAQGRGAVNPKMELRPGENLELKRMIEEGRKTIAIRAGSPYNFLGMNENPQCNAAKDGLIVGPEFDIYPCDAFKQIKAKEIVKTDRHSRLDRWSLSECWELSPYLNAVRQYLSTPFGEPCKSCSFLSKCLSGCLAQKVIKNGDLRKDCDPMCLRA